MVAQPNNGPDKSGITEMKLSPAPAFTVSPIIILYEWGFKLLYLLNNSATGIYIALSSQPVAGSQFASFSVKCLLKLI